MPARAFCLEITESAIMDDPQRAEAMLNRLSEQGFKLSIDDFGTGYSSLAYLTRLPLDQLKIDQSFVRNLGVKHTDDVIVQTIIGMARNLELDVIAEGVETTEHFQFLLSHGCQTFQGYLFGRPLALEDFERQVRQAA